MDYPRRVLLQAIDCRLNLAENLLMTHFARKFAATALADGGISITNLKHAGRWKLDAVAEGYLENSKTQNNEQMKLLDAVPPKNSKKAKNLQPVRNPNLSVLSAIYGPIPQDQPPFP
eukprot:1566012-Ditylum_brightwellii.AAC.1